MAHFTITVLFAVEYSLDPATCPEERADVVELRRILTSRRWRLVTPRDDIKPHFYTFQNDGLLVVVEQRTPTFAYPTNTTYGIVESGSSIVTIVGVPPEITYQDALVTSYSADTIVFHPSKMLVRSSP
ncbi:MAG: hypothetical protein IPF59_00680 [Ignavibacteria bacterium]|nr:hypothetical protein [Ignavibacteria bacterium]MBK6418780.1 hypothetical protein [Ignavibacteria bacterium]MBK7411677.1 hypothetical protein [Ignavibacteria bacterium]